MKRISLNILALFIISILFISCASSDVVTKEECNAQGLKYTKEKVLNFRTGKYEIRSFCKQY